MKRVTFTLSSADLETVVLAKLGLGTAAIGRDTGLTPCQIRYRLTKAKLVDGLPAGKGYISTYRDGTSWVARQVRRHFLRVVRTRTHKSLATPSA
jgi:hypothetical protein